MQASQDELRSRARHAAALPMGSLGGARGSRGWERCSRADRGARRLSPGCAKALGSCICCLHRRQPMSAAPTSSSLTSSRSSAKTSRSAISSQSAGACPGAPGCPASAATAGDTSTPFHRVVPSRAGSRHVASRSGTRRRPVNAAVGIGKEGGALDARCARVGGTTVNGDGTPDPERRPCRSPPTADSASRPQAASE